MLKIFEKYIFLHRLYDIYFEYNNEKYKNNIKITEIRIP